MRASKIMGVGLLAVLAAACSKEIKPPTAAAAVSSDSSTSVATGSFVRLDGSKSTDPNVPPRPLFFTWSLTDLPPGSHAQLNDPHFVQPVFQVDVPGTYSVQLTVTNGVATSQPAPVKITATQCGAQPPTASIAAMPLEVPAVGAPVTLSAMVSDPDNGAMCGLHQSLTWSWSLAGKPLGSNAALTNTSADLSAGDAAPQLLPDVPGVYTVALVVTDSTGLSVHTTLQITAGTCGANSPVASALTATPAQPFVGQAVALSATVNDADNGSSCSQALPGPQAESYAWALVGLPVGSKATLNNPTAASPTLVPDLAGQYDVRLVVTDATGLASVAQDVVVTVDDCSPVISSISATPATPGKGQTVQLAADVTASACAGMSPAFHYSWKLASLPAGSQASLNSATATDPSFVADAVGTYGVSLVVTDDLGRSASLTTTVSASQCGATPPTVESITASPTAPNTGDLVQLTATVSDADNNAPCNANQAISAYRWSFVSRPAGSHVQLSDATLSNPSFVADVPGDYVLALVVTDTTGLQSAPSTTSQLKITVATCGSQIPVATIVSPASVNVGSVATLSATVTNPDDTCLLMARDESYQWSFRQVPPGSSAQLNQPTSLQPSFVPDVAGDYIVRLVVTDSAGHVSAPAETTLTAGVCGATAPTITAINGPMAMAVGQAVQLSAMTADADNQDPCNANQGISTYQWSLISLPAGSHASLNNAAAQNPSFVPDVAGSYTVSLTVSDTTGRWSQPFTWTASISCGSAAPVIGAITVSPAPSPSAPAVGAIVTLGANVSDADNDPTTCNLGQSFSYQWSLVAPAGSNAKLNSNSSAGPSFIPDLVGDYVVQLVVTDSAGLASAPLSTTITVPCGSAAPVVQSLAFAPSTPVAQQAVTLSATVSDLDNGETCNLGQSFTYQWSLAAPVGSKAVLNSTTIASPGFMPDVAGSYVATLVVTDSSGLSSAPLSTTITVACGGATPAIQSLTVSPAAPTAQQLVTLSASVTDADNDPNGCNLGQTFTYQWSLAAPSGSKATLNAATVAAPTFVPDIDGTYEVTVVATDSTGRSSTPTTDTITIASCGTAPVVQSATANVPNPNAGQIVTLTAVGAPGDSCTQPMNFTYSWSLVQVPTGSRASLNGSTLISPSFVADVSGTYVAHVTVTDQYGRTSAPASVTVQAGGSCGNATPSASIYAPQTTTAPGSELTLTGVATSADNLPGCNLNHPMGYAWSITSAPSGSNAQLAGATTFQAGLIPDLVGTYQVSLIVTDLVNQNASTAATVTVTVATGTGTCLATPSAGTVIASPSSAHVGSAIALAASGVSDGCGGTNVTYQWSFLALPSGSKAQINDASLITPSFTADVAGTYQFALSVTNSGGIKSTLAASTVSVDVCGGQTPVAIAGIASPVPVSGVGRTSVQFVWPTAGTSFLLDASASYDPDNQTPCSFSQTLSYMWELLEVPAGYDPSNFGPANAIQPTLTSAVAGTYLLRLRVSDGTNLSAPVYVTLSVYNNAIPGLSLASGGWHRAYIDPISGNPRIVYYDNTSGFGALKIVGCTQYCNSTTPVWSSPATIVSGIGTAPVSPPSVTVDTDTADQAYGSVLVTFYDSSACALKAFMCTRSVSAQSPTGCLSAGDWPNNATLDQQSANLGCANNDGAASSVKFQYLGSSNANKSNYGYTVAYNETIGGVSNLKIAVCTADVQACFNTPSNLKKSYVDPANSSFTSTPSASAGLWPSLVMQPKVAGQPSKGGIAYYANGNSKQLRYVQCLSGCTATNSTWSSPVVLDSGSTDVGSWPSAVLDSVGRVHVSYIDAASATLKYTRCSDMTCGSALTPQVLDGPGNGTTIPNIPGNAGAGDTSLVVDSNNNPFITYFGTTYNPGPGITYGGVLRVASSSSGGSSGSWGASTLAVPATSGAGAQAGQANGAVLVSPSGNLRATYWDASSNQLRALFLGN